VTEEYYKGAGKIVEKNNAPKVPAPVKKYASLLNKLRAEFGDETVPGTALFSRELMQDNDVHRLSDVNVDDVEGLYEDADFRKLSAYDPASLDFYVPRGETDRQHIVLIDPPYNDDNDYYYAKELVDGILERKPNCCIVMAMPLIRDHRQRFSFPTAMKELAKTKASVGRYFCSIVVGKTDLEGAAVLVCNPTKDLDETLNEDCLEYLAQTMNKGKADYVVEQAMKKKRLITPG
jgi:23S rRNA A2030 N6-methylase RlmJ